MSDFTVIALGEALLAMMQANDIEKITAGALAARAFMDYEYFTDYIPDDRRRAPGCRRVERHGGQDRRALPQSGRAGVVPEPADRRAVHEGSRHRQRYASGVHYPLCEGSRRRSALPVHQFAGEPPLLHEKRLPGVRRALV